MRTILVLACCTVLAGCASIPDAQMYPELGEAAPETFNRTRTYEADNDDIWNALMAEMGARDFPFLLVEREGGIIKTEAFALGDLKTYTGPDKNPQGVLNPYLSCTITSKSFAPRGTRAELSLVLVEHDLTINGTYAVWSGHITHHGWMRCNSTGVLEAELFDAVAARLGE